MRRVLVSLLVTVCVAAAAPAWSATPAVTTHGYIPMDDGVKLRYTLSRPSSHGRYPVVLIYGPYDTGVDLGYYSFITDFAEKKGIAVLGLNMRGTGCSGGKFLLMDPQQGVDGAEAVEWIARQPWSDGHIGMAGISYEGISQLMTAGHRPPHLDAIAPGQVLGDAYRDVVAPGGIMQAAFGAIYPVGQAKTSYPPALDATADGDADCARNVGTHRTYATQMADATASPYVDSGFDYARFSPESGVKNIDVPVLMTRTWQDTQTGARESYLADQLKPLWLIEGNGRHDGIYDLPVVNAQIERFFEHYLTGADNGWENTPRIQVLNEIIGQRASWTTSFSSKPAAKPLTLYLSGDRRLSSKRSRDGSDSASYVYPSLSPSAPDQDVKHPPEGYEHAGWDIPQAPGGFLTFTTPRLARDAQILGHGNADIWLSSTAPDTDVQITLTEVRPDGQEVYLQRGWLRASHRKEDARRSTTMRPFHTHRVADAADLQLGEPSHMRVELFPIGHVFRKGSAIRLVIDAPTGTTGDWSFQFNPTPAINTIWHDAAHPSRLVLPLVKGSAPKALPACGKVNSEPCRASIAPVPSGTLDPTPVAALQRRVSLGTR